MSHRANPSLDDTTPLDKKAYELSSSNQTYYGSDFSAPSRSNSKSSSVRIVHEVIDTPSRYADLYNVAAGTPFALVSNFQVVFGIHDNWSIAEPPLLHVFFELYHDGIHACKISRMALDNWRLPAQAINQKI